MSAARRFLLPRASRVSGGRARIAQIPRAPFALAHPFHTSLPRMVVHNVKSGAEFEAEVQKDQVILVDFFATWCPPCKAIAPILASLSDQAENKQVKFLKVDVDELQDLAMKYGVTKMPTFLIIKGGQVVDKLEGASKPILENMLLKHR